ncbi:MAG: FAD-dependent oxidoreductase [Planctomycetia bacterium]|nr:FAD-dependent oxidoreductase [Planctomycetia bacterium]
MNSVAAQCAPSVAIVGGGLAGLAAAVALGTSGCQVDLFEARRSLGGRAASFRDPSTGEMVDHCQHVSMGCCTNLADFCRRTGIAEYFRRDHVLHFIGPDAKRYELEATRWLPAPLHLLGSFARLQYLSLSDRFRIGRTLWNLMRSRVVDDIAQPTVGQWLVSQGQSTAAIEHFWSVILVSALGEEIDRASLSAARKVLIDGFLAAREAYIIEIPKAPLGTLYGQRLEHWFAEQGINLHLNAPIRRVGWDGCPMLVRADGQEVRPDFAIVALPWSKLSEALTVDVAARLPWLAEILQVKAAPITGVHLWFDRPITSLPHAVIVGRLSQWIFNRGPREDTAAGEHYYQVVISASRELAGRDRQAIVGEVCRDLAAIWPAAGSARLLHARVVTEQGAVFSSRPGLDQLRPAQQTAIPGLLVAGDWTATHWPATMEGAVRSGYLAAESVLRSVGRTGHFLVPDLRRGLLARLLIKAG